MTESSAENRREVRRLAISVIYVTLMATLCVTSDLLFAVPPARAGTTVFPGVAVGSLGDSEAELMVRAGITYARADVGLDSRVFLNIYSVAKKHQINLIGILDYGIVAWNNSFTVEDWKSVVDKAQQSYPAIRVWEIWNEPTQSVFQVGYMNGSPEHYFDLLKSAYTILKTRDPGCTILGLGGAQLEHPEDMEFARNVFALGGGSFMDAISIHAYPYAINKGKTWSYYRDLWAQEIAQYRVFGRPLWVTETGLQSSQLTDADQTGYLCDSFSFFSQQGVYAYVWYQLTDYNSSGALRAWGLLRLDIATKASYDAYKDLIAGGLVVRRRS